MNEKSRACELIPAMLGAGLIFLPKTAAIDGRNGFAAVLLCVLPMYFAALLSGYMRIKTRAIYLLLALESIFAGGMFLRIYSELIGTVLLPEYNFGIIAAAMLLTAFYGCMQGKAAGARLAVLSVPLLLIFAALCLLPAARDMDIENVCILPAAPERAVKESLYAGAALALPFISVYADGEKNNFKSMPFLAAVWMPSAAAAFIWLSRFNYNAKQPILDLMYAGGGASSFIRRQEGLILGIITLSAYFMLKNLLECAAYSFGKGRGSIVGFAISAGTAFLLAFLPQTAETAENYFKLAVVAGAVLFLILLPLGIFLSERGKNKV